MEKKKRAIDDENLDQVTGGNDIAQGSTKYCTCLNPEFGEDDESKPFRKCLKCQGIRAVMDSRNMTGKG